MSLMYTNPYSRSSINSVKLTGIYQECILVVTEEYRRVWLWHCYIFCWLLTSEWCHNAKLNTKLWPNNDNYCIINIHDLVYWIVFDFCWAKNWKLSTNSLCIFRLYKQWGLKSDFLFKFSHHQIRLGEENCSRWLVIRHLDLITHINILF